MSSPIRGFQLTSLVLLLALTGVARAGAVACPQSMIEVDPATEVCPETVENSEGTAREAVVERPSVIVPRQELCADPARTVCGGALWPEILSDYLAQADLARLVGQEPACWELPEEEQEACAERVASDLGRALYTKDRQEAAQATFIEAQAGLLRVLDRQGSEGLQNTVRKTGLRFRPFWKTRTPRYNAEQKNLLPVDEIEGLELAKASVPTVYLEGLILATDRAPKALFATLAHELAHAIGPSNFRNGQGYSGYAFAGTLECLRHEDSVAARSCDAFCFDQWAMKLAADDPFTAKRSAEVAALCRQNPDVAYSAPELPRAQGCQQGQLDEAFAEWAAVEAYVAANRAELSVARKQRAAAKIELSRRLDALPALKQMLGGRCLAYREESFRAKLTYTSRGQGLGGHPGVASQLNRLWFAHPEIRAALGCGKTPSPVRYCEARP